MSIEDDKSQLPPEGGIDVNSNFTPTTKQPVPQVTGYEWRDMSLPDLHDQLIILQNRYYYMREMGKGAIAQQIFAGIQRIESIIDEKQLEAMRRGSYNVR